MDLSWIPIKILLYFYLQILLNISAQKLQICGFSSGYVDLSWPHLNARPHLMRSFKYYTQTEKKEVISAGCKACSCLPRVLHTVWVNGCQVHQGHLQLTPSRAAQPLKHQLAMDHHPDMCGVWGPGGQLWGSAPTQWAMPGRKYTDGKHPGLFTGLNGQKICC